MDKKRFKLYSILDSFYLSSILVPTDFKIGSIIFNEDGSRLCIDIFGNRNLNKAIYLEFFYFLNLIDHPKFNYIDSYILKNKKVYLFYKTYKSMKDLKYKKPFFIWGLL